MSSKRFSRLNATSTFASNRVFKQKQGNVKLGTDPDSNYVEPVVRTGSAFTQGQDARSFVDLNDNGDLLYDSTEADNAQIRTKYRSIFRTYPTLIEYPYLYPIADTWDGQTVSNRSREFPTYLRSGKGIASGLGAVEFYDPAPRDVGDEAQGQPQYMAAYRFPLRGDLPLQPSPVNVSGLVYPFSGKVYAGTLVQLVTTENDAGFTKVRVAPYQQGRGIPNYVISDPYTSGSPFGTPRWPDTNDPIEPFVAPGVSPGNANVCLGVVLDTESLNQRNSVSNPRNTANTLQTVFDYNVPPGFDPEVLQRDLHSKWFNHPAPFTAPEDITGFSPGPNSAGTHWAPWPAYYAYTSENGSENESSNPTPVLARGTCALRIGAAFNVGLQQYFEPDIQGNDDPLELPNKYVSVPCLPLFQGETVRVGSTVYAACMGHVVTPEPRGTEPYPLPSLAEANLGLRPPTALDQSQVNPWYDWFDPTYGAVGWTGTPQFLLTNVPDESVDIVQTKAGATLPYLSQANQGSVIVHPVSTADPTDPETGSGRMALLGPPTYTDGTYPSTLPALRTYPHTPERSLPVGTTRQSISGTGQWTYTGTLGLPDQTEVVSPGVGYEAGTTYVSRSLNGTGSGATFRVDAVDAYGTPTAFTVVSPGNGYVPGELVNVLDPAFETTVFFRSGFTVRFDGVTFVAYTSGSGYVSSFYAKVFPLEDNPLYVQVTVTDTRTVTAVADTLSGSIVAPGSAGTAPYGVGTVVYPISDSVPPAMWAELQVVFNNGTDLIFIINSGGQLYPEGTYVLRTTRVKTPVRAKITASAEGEVADVQLVTPPPNALVSTRFAVVKGHNNFGFVLDSVPETTALPFVQGGSGYTETLADILNPGGTDASQQATVAKVSSDARATGFTYNFPVNPAYTGLFGDTQSLLQTIRTGITLAQPAPAAVPPEGWPSYVYARGATFTQTADLTITDPGSGYAVQRNVPTTGGSGSGLTVYITAVDNSGGIAAAQVDAIGTGYALNDVVTVSGGTGALQLNVTPFVPPTTGGSGYTDANFVNCVNLTTNNFYGICGLETLGAGTCEIFSYSPVNFPPPGWDLRYYDVGDVLAFDQDGNRSATAEITFLDPNAQTIAFNQLTNGTGYTPPPVGDYAFLPTVNLTKGFVTVNLTTSSGRVTNVTLDAITANTALGDPLLIDAGDRNAVIQYTSERDVPPQWQNETNGRPATASEWNAYAAVLRSATNLLDKNVITNIYPCAPEHMNVSYYYQGDGGYDGVFDTPPS